MPLVGFLRRSFAVATVCCALIAATDTTPVLAHQTKFTHIVIIVQENRTPDNLFHGLKTYLPTADIADSGINSKGQVIPLTALALAVPFDLSHAHSAFVSMYDGGKMDGADLIPCSGNCPENPAFHYVARPDVQPYFAIAENYGFANRMFQTNQGPSFPAHQFLLAGTSQPYANSPFFASENTGGPAGCVAPPNISVPLIDPTGSEEARMWPCFEHATLSDLLDHPPSHPSAPVSWRYYTSSSTSIWTAPNAIAHLCEPQGEPPQCTAAQWTAGNVVTWPAQVLVDIRSQSLPAVSWVIPTGQDSDHPNGNQGTGPSWVASIVNAIGQSSYWDNTAILVTWDDWGGWYDHVAPPIDVTYGYYELGFRVPLLVVSAYTPKGYVSQAQHDFGSILRFVETVFDLGLIPPGNFADARANDLLDFFNFANPPRSFTPIPTKVPASYFIDRSRRMEPPDSD